ncbi:Gfo/Idh/MocA family protein [Myxococcota bacterium]
MRVRWGIIGCGSVCETKSGPAFQRARDSELVAVMRRDGSLAADFARRHGVPRWYTNAEALVRDPEVDAVYVATPPGSHLEHALLACAVGKPAYVEKPMARSHAECLCMAEAFVRERQPLFVAYYRRALPRFRVARELIGGGKLGTVTSVAYSYARPGHNPTNQRPLPWRFRTEHSGGGLLLDVGSHALDLIDYLLGPLSAVQGSARNLATNADVEDVAVMSFGLPGGAVGVAEWNFASRACVDRLEVRGTSGHLTCSVFGHEPVELATGEATQRFSFPVPQHIQQPLIESVVDELCGRGHCPSTAENAARTSWVMDQVLSEYYGGRQDDFWARRESWPGRRVRSSFGVPGPPG